MPAILDGGAVIADALVSGTVAMETGDVEIAGVGVGFVGLFLFKIPAKTTITIMTTTEVSRIFSICRFLCGLEVTVYCPDCSLFTSVFFNSVLGGVESANDFIIG